MPTRRVIVNLSVTILTCLAFVGAVAGAFYLGRRTGAADAVQTGKFVVLAEELYMPAFERDLRARIRQAIAHRDKEETDKLLADLRKEKQLAQKFVDVTQANTVAMENLAVFRDVVRKSWTIRLCDMAERTLNSMSADDLRDMECVLDVLDKEWQALPSTDTLAEIIGKAKDQLAIRYIP